MGKKKSKKGRQAGMFNRKSEQYQFQREWQTYASNEIQKRKQKQKQSQHIQSQKQLYFRNTNPQQQQQQQLSCHRRPTLQLSSLRRFIEHRQSEDQFEHRLHFMTQQQQNPYNQQRRQQSLQQQQNPNLSKPGSLLFDDSVQQGRELDPYGREFRVVVVDDDDDGDSSTTSSTRSRYPLPTLQALCLQTLAPILQDYQEALGFEELHYVLSLLPASALTVLSWLVSNSANGMTNSLLPLIGTHPHLSRLCIYASKYIHEEVDMKWKDLTNETIQQLYTYLQPTTTSTTTTGTTSSRRPNNPTTTTLETCKEEEEEQPLPQQEFLEQQNSIITLPFIEQRTIPDSWEDEIDDTTEDNNSTDKEDMSSYSNTLQNPSPKHVDGLTRIVTTKQYMKLQRLELGNIQHLSYHVLYNLLVTVGSYHLTHLCLSGSLNWDTGPKFIYALCNTTTTTATTPSKKEPNNNKESSLSLLLPNLQVLDLQGCYDNHPTTTTSVPAATSPTTTNYSYNWLTDDLILLVYSSYKRNKLKIIY